MIKRKAPLAAAIFGAVLIHILIFYVSSLQNWFQTETELSTFKLVLLPKQTSEQTVKMPLKAQENSGPTPAKSDSEGPKKPLGSQEFQGTRTTLETRTTQSSHKPSPNPASFVESDTPKPIDSLEDTTFKVETINEEFLLEDSFNKDINEQSESLLSDMLNRPSITDKPKLLDLSNIQVSSDTSDEALSGIFSEELKNKIAESKAVQLEYLKGQVEIKDYPITEGEDGARYVNIEGVCWKVPELGSDEPWSIVLSGCADVNQTFHFELNIAPSTLLGSESPFYIGQ